jgi:hypothetical protein
MADIKLHFEIPNLDEFLKQYALEIEQDMNKGLENLAQASLAHMKELANQELKSTKKQFMDNVECSKIAEGVYAVTIKAPAVWIDDGLPKDFDMKPGLLAKPDGINKKGLRYRVIPMDQAKAPSMLTPPAKGDLEELKTFLKEKKVPLRKIEMNADGVTARLGKIHSFDLGGRVPGKGNTPMFNGVNIYQHADSKGKVTRQVTTFRTVIEGSDKWIHPGMAPHNFLERTAQFAETVFETQILPEIMRKWGQ